MQPSRFLLVALALALLATRVAAEESAIVIADEAPEPEESYFSATAWFLGFREAAEACIIVAVLLQMCRKTGLVQFVKWVWIGVGVGVVLSCAVGGGLLAAVYAVRNDPNLAGRTIMIIEGVFSLLASAMLTWVSFSFLRFGDLETKMEEKMARIQTHVVTANKFDAKVFGAGKDQNDETNSTVVPPESEEISWWKVFVIAFSMVFREGVEVFVFLAIANDTPAAVGIGGTVGILCGIIFSVVIFYAGNFMKNLKIFLVTMSGFVLIIASGLCAYGTHEFEALNKWTAKPINHPILVRPLYSLACCPDGDHIWAVLRFLGFWRSKPTLAEVCVWTSYWMIILFLLTLRYKNGNLFTGVKRSGPSSKSSTDSPDEKLGKDEAPMAYAAYPAPYFSPYPEGMPMVGGVQQPVHMWVQQPVP